jgi:4-hydroxy-tetrahydrodipicolinate synthase
MQGRFTGVYCAAVTPMRGQQIDTEALQKHLATLAAEGCDGVLLMGTTGEGPSLSLAERETIMKAAVEANTGLKLLAGTGTPSLPETIQATRRAFELGAEGVVVVPPYYFRNAPIEGLRAFYAAVIEQAVPETSALLAYHIPPVSGVAVPREILMPLVDQFGPRMAGVKDSGGQIEYSVNMAANLPSLDVFVGSERLLLAGLQAGAVGCITAGANVLAPYCAAVYQAWKDGQPAEALQERLTAARLMVEAVAPAPATYKGLLALRHGGDGWNVRLPLLDHPTEVIDRLAERLQALDADALPWLAAVG